MENRRYIINLSCDDHPGIIRDVATFVSSRGGNVLQSAQSTDEVTGQFFLRMDFEVPVINGFDSIEADFRPIADLHRMKWRLAPADVKGRMLVMVSQYGHCLNDLLFRTTLGRDVECSALSRAVKWHLEQRIILDENRRTVVFR